MLKTLFPANVSSSMLSDIHSCRFRWFRKYVQHLGGTSVSSDLFAGQLFATACEITRKAIFDTGMDEDEAIALGKSHILEAENIRDGIKTNERTALAFSNYMRQFSSSSVLPARLTDGTHAIEYKFEVDTGIPHPDIKDRNILFTGRLDLVGIDRYNGREDFYVVDEKTTKNVFRVPGTKIPDIDKVKVEYVCRGQFIGYVFACRKLGLPVSKTIVRKVPILTNPEPAFEFTVDCNEAMLSRWEMATFGTIEELVERYKWLKQHSDADPRSVFTPVYNDACHSWGQVCAYHAGCILPEGDEILEVSMQQSVSYPLVDKPTSLEEYLRGLHNEQS